MYDLLGGIYDIIPCIFHLIATCLDDLNNKSHIPDTKSYDCMA